MSRAGLHYNLGTSRGPEKIGSRAGPGPRAVSCTWLAVYHRDKIFSMVYGHVEIISGGILMFISISYVCVFEQYHQMVLVWPSS